MVGEQLSTWLASGAAATATSLTTEAASEGLKAVSYTHLRAHETVLDLVCRLLLEKKKTKRPTKKSRCHREHQIRRQRSAYSEHTAIDAKQQENV